MIERIIYELNMKGIKFSLNSDKLKVSSDVPLNEEELSTIMENKALIIDYIKQRIVVLEAIPKTEQQEDYAVSSAQRRLWVLSKFDGANEAYNIPQIVRLEGSINESAFSSAYNNLLQRHEILRTVFSEDEQGNPRQRILPITDERFNIIIKDYSNDTESIRSKVAEIGRSLVAERSRSKDYVQQEIANGFDLEQGPLVRCSLLKETENSYVWVLVMHHIVSDGWSMGVLHKEFSELYNAALEQRSPELAPLSIQYKDYAAWHNAQLNAVDIKIHKEYWLEQFKGELPVLELPSDKSRPKVMTYNGASIYKELDKKVTDQLKAFSQQQGGTLFMALQTALNILLHKYTGQEDIVIGSPIAGREHPDLEGQIGFYINTLALRTQFSKEDTIESLYQKIKHNTLGAYSHQVYPYDELVDVLQLTRDMSRNPLFDVMLVLQSIEEGSDNLDFSNAILQPYTTNESDYEVAKFDLSFGFEEHSNGMYYSLNYNKDIYSEDQVERMLMHLEHLLHTINTYTQTAIKNYDILTQEEKTYLLDILNDTETDYPKDKTIVDLFEEQVIKTPNAVAIKFKDNELTYRELNEKSNQLAHYLSNHYKIQPDDLVGIELERSEWMVIGILAIIKSGGAYVPIDPEYPEQRKAFIQEDASLKLIINEEELTKFSQENKKKVYPTSNPRTNLHPNNLMYVIYTSGSTGSPKGCMLEHRGLVNRLAWMQKSYALTEQDCILQKTTFTFDVSVWELIWWSIQGASVSILEKGGEKQSEIIVSAIEATQVTVMHFVPSMLGVFLEYLSTSAESISKLKRLNQVYTSGEALQPEQAKRFKELLPEVQLMNLYGPTEASIDVSYYDCDDENEQIIPIGKPIDNTSLHVLDTTSSLVPYGSIGEICIGGVGLARGYLNREELTKEKFIENPYDPTQRLYRTGDLGRWREDGNLDYLGRMDDQVKIRGYRIELGEIEQALTSHTAVGQGVVIARSIHNTSDKELIAYTTGETTAEELKVYLKEKLPSYMVPNYYVKLESIPLTSNGKVDRKALPDPEGTGLQQGAYVAPRTEIEMQLVSIWSTVLGVEESTLSIKADFFDLGGHSIKAIRLLGQVHKQLGVKIALKELFTHPTIEQLSKLINASSAQEDYTSIPKTDQQEDYAVSSAQRRLWVLSKFEGANEAYNIPQVVRLEGNIDESAFSSAYNNLLQRHEVLRTVFSEDEQGNPRQRILPITDERFSIHIKDYSNDTESSRSTVAEQGLITEQQREDTIQDYVQQEIATGFDLEQGPLVRCSLLKETDSSYVWVLVMHHIVSDGWSMGVLHKEFSEFYNASLEQRSPELEPLSIQYKDYAAWHNAQLNAVDIKIHKEYWLEQFKGELPVLELPSDKSRPKVMTYNGASIYKELDKKVTDQLKAFSQQQGGTLFMALQTALNILLHKYTGQEDIVIGSPIAGREHPDLEVQIGFYINTLALRTQFSKEDTIESLYQKIKQNTLGAYSHQVYPYDELVDDLKLTRDMSRNPLFDVMLVLQSQEEGADNLEFSNATLQPYKTNESGYEVAKFDLSFGFEEHNNGMYYSLNYNTDIYNTDQVERMLTHLEQLLHTISAHTQIEIKNYNIITQQEKTYLLETLNATKVAYPKDKTIVDLFEEQVNKTPDALAIKFKDTELTYRELNEKSNQLANYLITNYDIEPDDLVGIELERSEWMVIGILAIIKSGGAYVPIDPEYPEQRKAFIQEDSDLNLTINEEELNKFREENKDQVYSTINPTTNLRPNNLIYVIYTSGSTGNPKGCMLEHGGLVNRLAWMQTSYALTEKDCILQKTTFTFDVSVWELIWWSLQGASVSILETGGEKQPEKIVSTIEETNVTVMHFVPSMLGVFLEYLNTSVESISKLQSLNQVYTSGEALQPEQLKRFKELLPDVKLMNLYGPTEASIDVSYYACDAIEEQTVPIGKPIDNTSLHVLDSTYSLVPYGSIGEICIGGVGLARGYLNREELTKEKFIENPYDPTQILYRTGDLGRWREDGNLEYLGRMDDQVKIRGYRIELGEIEQVVTSHTAVVQGVVIARSLSNSTDKELIAYTTGEATAEELKAYLKESLPSYMVPSYYVKLESIPLTSNGKVDRKALPDPEGTGLQQGAYVAPRTEIEKQLVRIWSEVLRAKQEDIGLESDFFALGGDSIKAIQIVARLRTVGFELKISDVMGSSRLMDMATKLRPLTRKIDQHPVEGKVLLSPIQNAFLENAFARGTEDQKDLFHQSFMLCFAGGITATETKVVIDKLIAHHDVLRMRYQKTDDGSWEQYNGGLEGDYYLFEEATLSSDTNNHKSNKEIFFEQQGTKLKQRIGFSKGLLVGVGLYHDKEHNESHLLFSIHHMVIDLVSWRILFEDIEILLDQYRKGKKLSLSEKTDSYRYWMERNVEYAEGYLLERQRTYWEHQQSSKVDKIEVTHPKGINTFGISKRVGFILSQQETTLMQQGMNGANKVETNALLLSALSRALKDVFDVASVRVLLEGHGREEYLEKTDISRTVGWFTSMYPFVLSSNKENIESVLLLQDALGQVPDKGVGYGLLRYVSKHPLPKMKDAQLTFNYLGDFTREEGASEVTTPMTFTYSEYAHGLDVHEGLERDSELEVSGQSQDGCLQMSIQYSAARMDEQQMEELAARYKVQLITISQELSQYGKTLQLPGSFTYKGLTLEQIAALEKEYGGIEDVYRLSPMQQGLYYHALSEPESHAYFEQFGYGLKGELDIAKLEQAYRTLIARHGVLRTVFRNDLADEPLQVVLKEGVVDFRYEDIRDKDYSQQEQYIKQLRESDKDESFDLSARPLVRLIIIQRSQDSFYQIWSNHHLNLDGWSGNAVLYEFDTLYKSLIADKQAKLETLEPYSSYIAWLDGIDHKKSRSYWNQYLADYDSKAILPFDREDVTRSANYIARDYEFWLSKELSDKISAIASKEKTTLNTIIQSAWGILLSRYNNTQDVVFGSVVSGRPSALKGIQEMIGIFINTIPQRIKYTEQTTFKELLQTTQQSFIAGEPHHHLNLAEIQHESDLGANLIDHLVVFENYPISGQSDDTTGASQVQSQQGEVEIVGETVEVFEQLNYDFTLMAAPEERLFFRMKYNAAKYSEGFIKRLEGQWNQLLEEITKDASLPIINYDILTQQEKTYLLETLNDTETDYPKDKTIVDLFEEQVAKTPDNIAIKFKDTELTYRELNEKSNQLANYLITSYDIQPDDLVGIELERSEWMVIGILAIIKSGGAYVPIDPEYPEQRKEYLIKDSNCKLVVNNNFLSEFLKIENLISNSSIKFKNNGVLSCIYTSGSTGLPKGVQISHLNLLNRIYWMWSNYPFQKDEVTAIKTTIGFVDHLWELFGSLLCGVKSVIIPQEAVKEIGCFAEIVNKEKISRLVLVPSLLKFILTEDDLKNQFTSVKIWTASGEVLPVELVDQFYRTFGTATLLNIYGSTEITADVTCFNTSTMIVDEKNSIPKLFNPISDTDKYAEELFRDIHYNPVHNGNFNVNEILRDDESLSDNLQTYITELDTVVKRNVINVNSRYFIGHMTGPIPPFLYYVNKKMVQMNQNQVKLETSGIGTSIEQKVVGFFHREIYEKESSFYDKYDFNKETSLGLLTSGGTLSNITALQLTLSKSLNELLEKQGTTLQEIGLANALNATELKGAVILASNLHHYSIQKAAKLMGLGTNAVIPFSSKNKEELNRLISQLKNENKLIIALIGIAGTTESGEVDDLPELYKIAAEHKIHFHVDAAFGGAFILSSHKNKLKGIEYADSVTICGHKQLYTPIGCSLVLFKSPYLVKFSEHNARYQARKGSSDLGKFTNEGTRPFTALTLDAVRKLHLDGAYKEVLDGLVDKTNWMYRFLKQYDFIEVYAPPTLNILLYRYIPENLLSNHKSNILTQEEQNSINKANEELQQLQFQEGNFFVSQTRLKIGPEAEKVWLRVVLMNPFTSKKDIQAVVLNQFQKLSISAQTETCIYSLTVPIGKSISNTKVLILDDRKKIQPPGAIGEICIVGDAVANYLNENNGGIGYTKNPFDESKIMYCTGDFGRYLQDGNLLYEGRRDQQVKIAGNRVNVSEIRKVTLEVKDIRDAFIPIHQNQIVMFVEGDEILKNEIQLKLQTNLPRFMQPARIMFINQFILNANGKLDKKKMSELLEKEDLSENQLFEGTWLDGKIQKIWSRVLQKQEKEIPFNKDFFELGGDSLKLMSLTAAINKTFDKKFRFRDLLEKSTIVQIRDLINSSNIQSEKTFYRLNSVVENTSPLLLLPPSNGEGLVYKNLAKMLDQKIEIWTVDYNKGDGSNMLDIQIYAQELAALWKREIGNKKIKMGGYSLGFRVAYHMALVFENRVEKLINIDGMLYKSKQEEKAINERIIEEESRISSNDSDMAYVNNIQENIDLNLQKWFKNDYFISKLNVQVHHFIGEDSPVKNHIPEFVSQMNEIIFIQGSHENVLEIEENLELITKKI